jgi:hypothetical protein
VCAILLMIDFCYYSMVMIDLAIVIDSRDVIIGFDFEV